MPSFSNTSDIILLNNASAQINRYVGIFIVLFGIIGNILNILVLIQRSLRINPCSWIFLILSIVNLIAIICGVTTRILSGWKKDFTATNHVLCKIRGFIVFNSLTIAMWLITLASIDRWFLSSTNAQRRKMSTLKNAQRNTLFIVIFSSLIYSHIFYCFQARITGTPMKCYGATVWCRYLTDVSFAFLSYLFPLILMIWLGWLTILNVRHSHRCLRQPENINRMNANNKRTCITTNMRSQNRMKKTDLQLVIMLIVQIIVLAVCVIPLTFHRLYLTFTANSIRTPLRISIENFLFHLLAHVCYLANGMPFYIYTLSGNIFRQVLFKLVQTARQKIF